MKKLKTYLMKRKKYPTYAKQSFVLSKMRKMNTKKSEIIDITQENLEELLIVLAI